MLSKTSGLKIAMRYPSDINFMLNIVLWLLLPIALCCTNMYCFLNDCYLCLLFQTEGPLYWTTMALHILSPAKWKERRVKLLDRCMVLAQTRHVTPGGTKTYANLKVISHRNFKKKKITLHWLLFVLIICNWMIKKPFICVPLAIKKNSAIDLIEIRFSLHMMFFNL